MSYLLSTVLLVALVTGRYTLPLRYWGNRLLAVTVLLALSFFSQVAPDLRNLLVLGTALGMLVLAVTLPASVDGRSRRPVEGRRWNPLVVEPTLIAMALTGWMMLRNLAATGGSIGALTPYLLSLLVLASIHQLRHAGRLDAEHLVQPFIVFMIAVLLLAPFSPAEAWQTCRPEKCSLVGEIYVGIFPSENAMAIFAAFAISLAITSADWRVRYLQSLSLAAVLVATGARTALVGLILAVLVGRLAVVLARPVSRSAMRLGSWPAVAMTSFIVGAGMVLTATANDLTLSGRGRTWTAALSQVPLTSMVGAGSSRWVEMQELGLLTQHFPHSQLLHLHFGGGWIATGLWTVLVSSLITRVRGVDRADLARRLVPALLLLFLGLTEIIWNPATVDSFSVLIGAALLLSPRSHWRQTDTAETSTVSPAYPAVAASS